MSNLSFLRMATRFTIALAILFSFASCSGGGGSSDSGDSDSSLPSNGGSGNPPVDGKTPLQKLTEMRESGELPKLDRSDDLAGPDVNNNGVRDDVENYIIKKYPDERQKRALLQFAKNVQKEILVDKNDKAAVRATLESSLKALSCVREMFPPIAGTNYSIAYREIVSITTNTRARIKAYYDFNRALHGATWGSMEGDTCE